MKKLINKIIDKIVVFGNYHDGIKFETNNGNICFHAYGDCCSSSFFSEIFNPENIIGQEIIEVKDIYLQPGEAPNRGATEDDNEQIYGVHITSKKGTCTIIFRNHSNGYYGGSIEDTEFPIEPTIEWLIEKDWSAPSL